MKHLQTCGKKRVELERKSYLNHEAQFLDSLQPFRGPRCWFQVIPSQQVTPNQIATLSDLRPVLHHLEKSNVKHYWDYLCTFFLKI